MPGISVVINTLNEERNIERAINSVKWAEEIIVCDMRSADGTVEISKKLGARIISYKRTNYVEPARNFAISKASEDWIFILDADEEVSGDLSKKIQDISKKLNKINYVEIPRKNIIFNKWMKAGGWWPDYQIRFFKKGMVLWQDGIHSRPKTKGEGLTLPAEENLAILHQNYQSIAQFLDRMNRYTAIEAESLHKKGLQFKWADLFEKPLNEFLSRFFANKGYQDGVHGLTLSFLQAFSFLVVYLKLWEKTGFKEKEIGLKDFETETKIAGKDINYWVNFSKGSKGWFKRWLA